MAGPLGLPTRDRTITIPPQTITQKINGVTKIGTIQRTGGTARVQDDSHDLTDLGVRDCGGPLIVHKTVGYATMGVETLKKVNGGLGSQVALRPTTGIPGAQLTPDRAQMWGQGGTAIARTLPTRPAFEGGEAIAQSIGVRAIPRMVGSSLWRARAFQFKQLGDEYLNVQFGWLPFVNDILDCMRAVRDSDDFLHQRQDGSGKITRVGYEFPEQTSTDSVQKGFTIYSVDGSEVGRFSQSTANSYVSTTFSRTWFKGAFYYYLPVSRKNMSQSEKFRDYADHVLGLNITPETLWDAAPWSWAVDWALDVGDVARNIGAIGKDGLVLLYGYIMTHKGNRTIWYGGGNVVAAACSLTLTDEWKTRWPASPYGFGLTYEGLSLTQKSILAAIGISHW
jgi:hypothetical protein